MVSQAGRQSIIREASLNDLSILQSIMKETFADTFGANYPPEELESFLQADYSAEAVTNDLNNVDKRTYLMFTCENGIELMGYAMLSFNHPHTDVNVEATGKVNHQRMAEIQRFYFLKNAHGTGLASLLMQRILSEIKSHPNNFEVCWLGVWQENHRAISFYQKFGFEKIGVKEFLVGSVVDRDWILELQI